VRWLELSEPQGPGLRFRSLETPFAASAWPYTLADLHDARHITDLPSFSTVTLNVDCLQNGLGDAFVRLPEVYKLKAGETYSFEIVAEVC